MKRVLFTIGLLILMGGCSTRILYPNLDWIIPFYVNDYVSFNNKQDNILDKKLIRLLEWHCQTQLPSYSATLKTLASELDSLPGALTTNQVRRYSRHIEKHWNMLLGRLLPQGAELMVSATDTQVAELIENLKQGNIKFQKKHVEISSSKKRDILSSNMVNTLNRWIRQITEEQKQLVDEWSLKMNDIGEERLKHRMLLVDEFSKILQGRNSSTSYKADLMELLVDLDTTRNPEYLEMLQHNRNLTHHLLVDLYSTLDQEQHRHLINNIVSLAGDFDSLTCQTNNRNTVFFHINTE